MTQPAATVDTHLAIDFVYLKPGFKYPPCLCVGCGGPKEFNNWGHAGPVGVLCRAYGGWIDHPYRLRNKGRRVWVAEPYGIQSDAIRDLARLEQAGYGITVSAEMARHAPGRTVAILIFEPGTSP